METAIVKYFEIEGPLAIDILRHSTMRTEGTFAVTWNYKVSGGYMELEL